MIDILSSVNNYLAGSEDVNSDEVQDRILQTARRAARRVVQHKIANEFADTRSDRDSNIFDDSEKQILAMENFNGLQE
jgi:ribosomal protein S24E